VILVAGATGYIGRLLARSLLESGEAVRCLARDVARADDLAAAGAEVVRADVLEPATLGPAMEGVELAHYLVHSMGRGGDGDFAARDRAAARNFGAAAGEAGVGRIVYLGGLGEGPSKHLRSRHETALELERSGVPLTYLRAAAVIGAGSESFRTIYYLVKRLPLMVTPRWTENRTQPIAIADVLGYLTQAARVSSSAGRTIEIGGPEVTTYAGLMEAMADALGIRRPRMISVPVLSPALSSHWIGLVTPVDAGVARPLVEGLATDTIVTDPSGMELFEVEPTPVEAAMRAAVAELREGER
jgi:uncharacterized protein YbjT (DUF2867 family)